MNKLLEIGFPAFSFTVLLSFSACQKNESSLAQATGLQNNQQKKVPRQSSSEGPARRWVAALGDCDNIQENCAPTDAVVIYQPSPYECIPCKVLREIISDHTFRANANFDYKHIGKNFPGVSSSDELNLLDDPIFYATLFPDLNDEQRSMFYSGQYEIMLKHDEGQEKFFVLFGIKGQTIDNLEANPVFVVPFTFDYK